ncbi:hypothetical protein AB3X96_24195 [Paraburkholderia sp. BR13439]|uniref:hypothetical protein n=1 Tax=Paraburkholderia sp. BR13439 TaxID=3236996 RepID=UPI0034CF27A7
MDIGIYCRRRQYEPVADAPIIQSASSQMPPVPDVDIGPIHLNPGIQIKTSALGRADVVLPDTAHRLLQHLKVIEERIDLIAALSSRT